MYRVYCDGNLLHDSNIQQYSLVNPGLDVEVNKSGKFTFQITHKHEHYDKVINKKSYIDIYEDGKWLWSGRPVKVQTFMKLHKTVTCEGELSYLHDSNQELAEYHDLSVEDYFKKIIEKHNADVEEDKRFVVGNVTVTDPNNSLYRFSNYEDTFNTIQDKLINRLGGYIVIRHEDGVRYIDYLADYPHVSNQVIRFGSNIIDVALDESFDDVITAIIPLGAKLNEINQEQAQDETGNSSEARLTIDEVNGGLNYIVNDEAVRRFGMIKGVVKFDDVTLPSNLLSKGYEALVERIYSKLVISLKVFDRGYLDKNIDKYRLGAKVIVDTEKHGLSHVTTMIKKMQISLVDVTKTKIETGITKRTLTDSFVQSDNNFDTKVENIVSDYVKNEEIAVINPQINNLHSLIEQTAEKIRSEVASEYMVVSEKEEIYRYISSMVEQSANDITMTFKNQISGVENTVILNQQNLEKYIRFNAEGIELGDVNSPFKSNMTNTEIYFSQSGQKIAFISNNKLYITNAEFINKITIGRAETGYYDQIVRDDGHFTLSYRAKGSES